MGHIAFSKDGCTKMSHPICFSCIITLTFFQKEMGSVFSPFEPEWALTKSRNRRDDTAWLPRLGHVGSRESIWLPCSQSTYPLNSATILWGSQATRAGHIGVSPSQHQPTTWCEWNKHSDASSPQPQILPADIPDTANTSCPCWALWIPDQRNHER